MESEPQPQRMQGQVAGHLWEENKVGFLALPGRVLKPLEGERGARELAFYRQMAPNALWYLCAFHGTRRVGGLEHLELGDLRAGLARPCVMDLKVGRRCFTPWHGPDKIASEMQKYALQAEVGFRCAGMRLEDEAGREALLHRKVGRKFFLPSVLILIVCFQEWGRAIVPATVPLLFDTFFADELGTLRVTEAREIAAQLARLVHEAEHSFRWSLYAGSVLLLRDAASHRGARVALVDFSYVFPEPAPGHDNLLFGLRQLSARLGEWLAARASLPVQTTLLFVRAAPDRLLLARKKRGLGVDKWNGPGGKRQGDETAAAAAARECEEETGLAVAAEEARHCGVIEFRFVDRPAWDSECHLFAAEYRAGMGEPRETEEMAPRWFAESELPWEHMWPDDRIWLPRLLRGETRLHYRFWHSAATSQIVRYEQLNQLTET